MRKRGEIVILQVLKLMCLFIGESTDVTINTNRSGSWESAVRRLQYIYISLSFVQLLKLHQVRCAVTHSAFHLDLDFLTYNCIHRFITALNQYNNHCAFSLFFCTQIYIYVHISYMQSVIKPFSLRLDGLLRAPYGHDIVFCYVHRIRHVTLMMSSVFDGHGVEFIKFQIFFLSFS